MTEENENNIADAILELAKAVNHLADSVAIDEPLNYAVARGLDKIAEALIYNS